VRDYLARKSRFTKQSYTPSGVYFASAIPESRGFDWLLHTKNTLSVAIALVE
jgi:hypothetical protein